MLGNSLDHHWLFYPMTRALRLAIVLTALSGIAHAQITVDGSLGPGGALIGPNFVIPSSVGQTRGGNLFHSFGLFNVLTNQSATFTGPNTISNILGRVTGGQSSVIDGLIRSTIPGANLYLMNPAGMLFGPNASLNVQGSFHATTADYLKFTDGAMFHADLSKQSVLTSAPVSAFGFLSQNPAKISVQESVLEIADGKTLSLVGGDIDVTGGPLGFFAASGGQINLASVASPGEVPVNVQDLNTSTFNQLGQINLRDLALADASGNGGGTVVIRGRKLVVDNSSIFADNLGDTNGSGLGVDIRTSGPVFVSNGSQITTDGFGAGRAKDLLISGSDVIIDNSSLVESSAFGSGNPGNVIINRTNSLSPITPSGNLGTTITQVPTGYNITGGTRNGNNLFHSFGVFNLGTGDTANFLNDTGLATTNILGRVTGGQRSDIFGSIKTTNFGAANLFLINPAGWLFGPSASLNVGGSFHVSTANYLKFADGAEFHADLTKDSVLTSAPVSAFGFLSQNPAGISIFGSDLQVPAGNGLALIGGDIELINGRVKAPAGQISLASVASPGEVPLNVQNLDLASFDRLGQIDVSLFSRIDASGNGGGSVIIRGGRLTVDRSSIFSDSTGNIDGTGLGVDIRVAEEAIVANRSFITTDSFGSGHARNLQIATDSLKVDDSSVIGSSPNEGSGNGGNVIVNARSLTLDHEAKIFSGALAKSSGNAGDLEIHAENVTVTGGAQIFNGTFGSGNGGAVRVTATDTVSLDGTITRNGLEITSGIFSSSENGSTGSPGNIIVEGKNVIVTGGAGISSSTSNSRNGGTLTVRATDTVSLSGISDGPAASRFFANADEGSSGNAGDVLVKAKNVAVTSGAQIASVTHGPGHGGTVRITASDAISVDGTISGSDGLAIVGTGIFASSQSGSTGNGGNVMLEAKNITVTGLAQVGSGTFGSGKGGTLTVRASDTVSVSGESNDGSVSSGIFAQANPRSTGDAGDLSVEAQNVMVNGGAKISSQTFGPGKGGTVRVSATNTVSLQGADSAISSTSAQRSTGNAGTVLVEAENVTVTDGAQISSVTFGPGDGGTVRVKANEIINLDGAMIGPHGHVSSGIFASTQLGSTGNAGDVVVQTKDLNLSSGARISSGTFGTGKGGTIAIISSNSIVLSGEDSEGSSSAIITLTQGPGDAGRITLTTPVLTVDSGVVSAKSFGDGAGGDIGIEVSKLSLANGAQIDSSTFGIGLGGTIAISAKDSVTIGGPEPESPGVRSGLFTVSGGSARGGDIRVHANNIALKDGALISAQSFDTGNAGNIFIAAARQVSLNDGATITATSEGAGNAGTVRVTASDTITLTGKAPDGTKSQISSESLGRGDGGSVEVRASQISLNDGATITVRSRAESSGAGNAGDIVAEAKSVTVTGGAQISSDTVGPGNGGRVRVTASELVSISGTGSGFFSTASGTGNAGQITVAGPGSTAVPTLTMADGGKISVETSLKESGAGSAGSVLLNANRFSLTGGAQVVSSTSGAGQGGSVRVNATDSASISGQDTGLFSNASGTGPGGTIDLQTAQLQISDAGVVSANSTGTNTATAGNINVVVSDTLRMENNANITTDALSAAGGNISITSTGSLLHMTNSQVTTSVRGGEGQGGNITIGSQPHPFDFMVLNNSGIHANAFGGPGGNINIFADTFLSSLPIATAVTASSANNTPGTVNIQAAITNVSGLLQPLPENIFQATALLQQSCAARFTGGKLSSLAVGSRDGLPLEPGGFMPSPLYRLGSQPDTSITQRNASSKSDRLTLASVKPPFSVNWPCTK